MPPPLFEVPGWDVQMEPTPSSSSKNAKKRKRPHDNDALPEKLESAQVNLEKLMDVFDRTDPIKRPPKKKHKGKKSAGLSKGVADNKPPVATPPKASPEKAKPDDVKKLSKKKKETHTSPKEKGTPKPHHPPKVSDSEDLGLTKLQNRMRKKLDGARFR